MFEIELPDVLLLQDVANGGHAGPRRGGNPDAFHPLGHVDDVALRWRLQPHVAGHVDRHLRHGDRRTRCSPVVAVLEGGHADTGDPTEAPAQRRRNQSVRRLGQYGKARTGVEDGSAAASDVPHAGGDGEHLAVDGDALDADAVEGQEAGVEEEFGRAAVRRGKGGSETEGKATGGVSWAEVVDEAIGKPATEAGGCPGGEGNRAIT